MMLAQGNWAEARPLLERAVRADPRNVDAAFLLARTLQMLGEREPAAYQASRCVELRPSDVNVRIAAAELLQAVGKLTDAERLFREGAAKFPAVSSMHAGLINALRAQGRVGEAGDAAIVACTKFDRDPLLATIGAGALGESLRSREATALIRKAAQLAPADARILRAAATMLLYADDVDDAELARVHLAAAAAMAKGIDPATRPIEADGAFNPEKRLRVALVSPDFRDHAVARFLESWIGQHDRSRLDLIGVSLLGPEDAATQRLRSNLDGWLDVSRMPDDAASAAVRQLGCDLAIDLAGWHVTARPGLFARRVAPVQVNWLGYAHATGLSTMDARLVDAATDPDAGSLGSAGFSPRGDGVVARNTTEPLVGVEGCFVCFATDARTPEITSGNGESHARPVRFASFNAQQKISPTTMDLWCRVLTSVEGSELVLKSRALGDARTRQVLDEMVRARGVDPSRVRVLAHAPGYAEHMDAYNGCDVALDTTPYAGTTTTCEALMMGLPVVTLRGPRHAARVGASLLGAAGQQQTIASDAAEFVQIAARLGGEIAGLDAAARAAAKRQRRAEVLASSLCDGASFAGRWERAIRAIWNGITRRGASGG